MMPSIKPEAAIARAIVIRVPLLTVTRPITKYLPVILIAGPAIGPEFLLNPLSFGS
jgi:hypothetical protein